MGPEFSFDAELWLYDGNGAWQFVTMPAEQSKDIKAIVGELPRKGFGSVRVKATVGHVSWKTSIFPDTKSASYVLPVKKDIRKTLQIDAGDKVKVKLELQL